MEIYDTKQDGLKRSYKIKIASNDVVLKYTDKIDEIQKAAKLPGFRPGKVPKSYLEQRFGQSVTKEIIDELIREASLKLIKDKDLRMASQPTIDIQEYKEGKDLNYEFQCELFPEIAELDYQKIKLTNYIVKISKAEIEKQIEFKLSALKSFQEIKNSKDIEVRKGMGVKINYEGYIDGKKFDGGSSKDYQLEIGSKTFIDSFEDQLVGLKIGDHKKVKVKFPKDYHKEEYQGKTATFEVDILDILQVIRPELNDKFAKEQGVKNVAEYHDHVKKEIETVYKKQSKEQFKKELFDYVDSKVEVELPPSMVDNEFQSLITQYLQEHNLKTEEEAETKDSKKFKQTKKEYLAIAKRRVKVGLLLSEISRKNNIEVTDNEVMQELQNQMAGYPGNMDDFLAYYRKNPQATDYIKGPLLEEKVVDYIHEKVSLKDKELTIGQFQKIYN